ncbi:MAG TPA: ATP-binding cassette domain-containing protein [Thermoanaerobaculia bacterium]
MPVEYRDVTVTVPGRTILDRVSLTIADGERVAFLGRSGAGKTTALKVINGLVPATSGELRIDGAPIAGRDLTALRRSTGYVMQQPALFPHRTVFDNIATVPRLLEWPEERIRASVTALLERLELPGFEEHFPRMLSGGEQQRVAIARALIAGPRILLCDEPFSALDPLIRADLQELLLDLTRDTTLVFVTHDVREALRVAERVVLFDRGAVVVDGGPAELRASEHDLVRRFLASAS